jgi:hypothetical protein
MEIQFTKTGNGWVAVLKEKSSGKFIFNRSLTAAIIKKLEDIYSKRTDGLIVNNLKIFELRCKDGKYNGVISYLMKGTFMTKAFVGNDLKLTSAQENAILSKADE